MGTKKNQVVVVGCGGVGGVLIHILWKMINSDAHTLTLIDGDNFEFRNMDRQYFNVLGNKALSFAESIEKHNGVFLKIVGDKRFIDMSTVAKQIKEDCTVFVCVDNDQTRDIINNHAKALKNVIVICGGNELHDGSVQFFVRKDGEKVAGDYLDTYHKEVTNSKDWDTAMAKPACDKQVEQYLITNANTAVCMLNVFFKINTGGLPTYSEVYFDAMENKSAPIARAVAPIKKDTVPMFTV